ncbi:MAG: hypothetical protein ACRDPE_09300 [Solirubrobacterales bacterium]
MAATKAEKDEAAAAATRASKPTKRVLLMEFEIPSDALKGDDGIPEEIERAIVDQIGFDDEMPKNLTVLIVAGEGEGGPKAVIESNAKTQARFRAISRDSFDQGHEAIPPESQKFELKPL